MTKSTASNPRIWSHLLKKSLIENFIFLVHWYTLDLLWPVCVGELRRGITSESKKFKRSCLNLIHLQSLLFRLYLRKFVNDLVTYPQINKLAKF